ncbi:MAG: hypothetical protein PUP91_25255 [Rhizonema sp. PD37]|nr:hypothetical protein [Rhizonema sp. PD37]
MSQEEIQSIQKQIAETEKNLRLIKERISEYVDDTTIPLDLKKMEASVEQKLDKLKETLSNFEYEQEFLVNAMTNVTFVELDIVTRGILLMPIPTDDDYNVLSVRTKISKNEITGKSHIRLMTGVIQAKMVGSFVENMVHVIPDFPEKLKAGFLSKYQKLQLKGLKGNALLDALHEFSCDHSPDNDLRAAGLAVLYYLFEKCEVFER